MAVSAGFSAYVVEQLAPLGQVDSRRMFGGVGLYADGLFFGLISADTLYLRVDDRNRPAFVERHCKAFVPFRDKPEASMNYFDVPADVLEDSEELTRWARGSMAAALAAANSKAKPRVKKNAVHRKAK